jgi:hypothetical protein
MRLDPAPLSDGDASLNLHEWPNEAARSDDTSIKIDRFHDGDVFAKGDVHDSATPDFGFCHKKLWFQSGVKSRFD